MALERLKDFLSKIHLKEPEPVVCFLGSDRLLRKLVIDAIEECIGKEAEKEVIYASDASPSDVIVDSQTYSMFSSKRLILVYQFQSWSAGQREEVIKYSENPNPNTFLLLFADSPQDISARKRFREWFLKASQKIPVVELALTGQDELIELLEEVVKRWGKRIHPQARSLLLELVGDEPERLYQELEKICLFLGKAKLITPEVVGQVVAGSQLENVFELGDALGKRDVSRALEIFRKIMQNHQPVLMILGLVHRHFRILYELNSALGSKSLQEAVMKKYRIPQVIQKQYLAQAERIEEEELEKAFEYLYQAERALKSSPVDAGAIFESLIIKLARL